MPLLRFEEAGSAREVEVPETAVVFSVGRSHGCDLRLPAASISRRHLELRREHPNRWFLVDGGSANGTFVAGRRITRHELAHRDQFSCGDYRFTFLVTASRSLGDGERTLPPRVPTRPNEGLPTLDSAVSVSVLETLRESLESMRNERDDYAGRVIALEKQLAELRRAVVAAPSATELDRTRALLEVAREERLELEQANRTLRAEVSRLRAAFDGRHDRPPPVAAPLEGPAGAHPPEDSGEITQVTRIDRLAGE